MLETHAAYLPDTVALVNQTGGCSPLFRIWEVSRWGKKSPSFLPFSPSLVAGPVQLRQCAVLPAAQALARAFHMQLCGCCLTRPAAEMELLLYMKLTKRCT